MTSNTMLPRPEGNINFSYSPMSPPNWDIVPSATHTFVYRDVTLALRAMLQATATLQAQRLEAGTAGLFTDHLYFRGQPDVSYRLLPTRLRGARRASVARPRFHVDDPPQIIFNGQEFPSSSFSAPPGRDPRDHFGDWYEEVKPKRVVEDSAADLPDDELRRRDARERAAVERAGKIAEVAGLDDFQQRAAVRHYSSVPSALLDVSTDPEVAAFFATGGGSQPPPAGQIGILWAIDLNFLHRLFSFEIVSIPNGSRIRLREERDKWGDNKQIFEEYGIQPTRLELTSVGLPFRRPLAQHARFFSLSVEDGAPLPPLLTELTWWSIIERAVVSCAFIHDGHTYENPSHNITRAALLPTDEPLAIALEEEMPASETLAPALRYETSADNVRVAFSPRGPYREVTSQAPWVIVFTLKSIKGAPTLELARAHAHEMATAYDGLLSQVDDFLRHNEGYWIRERHTPAEVSESRTSSVTAWGIVRVPSGFDLKSLPTFADIARLGRTDDVYIRPWDKSTHEVVIHFDRVGTKRRNKDSQRVITRGLRFDEIFDLDAARNEQLEMPAAFFRDLLPYLHARLKAKSGGTYTLEDSAFYITSSGMGDNFDLPRSWWPLINSTHVRGTSDATLAEGVDRVYIDSSVEENVKHTFGD